MPNPRFPVFVPSRSRAESGLTMRTLDRLGVPYRIIIEEGQRDEYAARWSPEQLLILDPAYQRDYETCDDLGDSAVYGPGPARNFAWDLALAEGHEWHWTLDDNISMFERFHRNQRIPLADGTGFHAMETFVLRYSNVAQAGPNYHMFSASRQLAPPFKVGTRIYSCQLTRTDVPFRYRGRWNDDTILSLDLLKAGWATVLFNAFLQFKMTTQTVPGGLNEAYREHGTIVKSQMLIREHPDVARLVKRWGRWHHYVDYSRWRGTPLIRRPKEEVPVEDPYEFRLVPRKRGG